MWPIRTAREDDRKRILQLWVEAGLGTTTDAEWEAIIRGPSARVLVAEDAGAIVGTAVTAFEGWRAYIYHIAVAADHRGQGLAQRLMTEGEEILRARGAHRVYLQVNEANTAGLALSASMGYEPEGDISFVKEMAPARVLAGSSV